MALMKPGTNSSIQLPLLKDYSPPKVFFSVKFKKKTLTKVWPQLSETFIKAEFVDANNKALKMIGLCWIPSLRKGQLINLKDQKEQKSNFIIQLKNHKIFQESCPIRSQQSKKKPADKARSPAHKNSLSSKREEKKQ